jgi:hypothetical protein
MAYGFDSIREVFTGHEAVRDIVEGFESCEEILEAFTIGEIKEDRFCQHCFLLSLLA